VHLVVVCHRVACNTLQHTATHCNMLQHAATHCGTLQHTARHQIPVYTLDTCASGDGLPSRCLPLRGRVFDGAGTLGADASCMPVALLPVVASCIPVALLRVASRIAVSLPTVCIRRERGRGRSSKTTCTDRERESVCVCVSVYA